MELMTIQQASEKWEVSERRIQVLCTSGRIPGAQKFGRQWAIPADLDKPVDARVRTGKYRKAHDLEQEEIENGTSQI